MPMAHNTLRGTCPACQFTCAQASMSPMVNRTSSGRELSYVCALVCYTAERRRAALLLLLLFDPP